MSSISRGSYQAGGEKSIIMVFIITRVSEPTPYLQARCRQHSSPPTLSFHFFLF